MVLFTIFMRRGHPLLIKNTALQHIKIFPFTCCKPVPPCILFLALSPQPLYSPSLPPCTLSSSSVLSLSALSPQPLYSPCTLSSASILSLSPSLHPLPALSLQPLYSPSLLPQYTNTFWRYNSHTKEVHPCSICYNFGTPRIQLHFMGCYYKTSIKNVNGTELYINVVFLLSYLLFTPLAREMAVNSWDSEIR